MPGCTYNGDVLGVGAWDNWEGKEGRRVGGRRIEGGKEEFYS